MNYIRKYRFTFLLSALTVLASIGLLTAPAPAKADGAHRQGKAVSSRSAAEERDAREQRKHGGGDRRNVVLPPHSVVAGKTIAEWADQSWQWVFSFPAGQSPVFDDETGALGYLGDVGGPVFHIGAASDVDRSFSVPCGQHILFALMTQAWALEGADTEASARAENEAFLNTVTALHARIDGKRVPNLFRHRETSPRLFPISVPDGGLFGDVGGNFDAVSDGYWLMLKPLSPGKHVITFGGTALDGEFDYRARIKLQVSGHCHRR